MHPELFSQIGTVSPHLISQYFDGDLNQVAVILLIFVSLKKKVSFHLKKPTLNRRVSISITMIKTNEIRIFYNELFEASALI